jgi:hypothetical protein
MPFNLMMTAFIREMPEQGFSRDYVSINPNSSIQDNPIVTDGG